MSLLGKLAVGVFADINQLKSGFGEMKKEARGLDRELKKHGLSLQQISKYGIMAGTAIVSAMGAMVLSATRAAVAVDNLAKTTGASRETIQMLGYAAQQEHASMEQLGTGLSRLARNMYEASNGTGEALDVFKDLRVAVVDSSGCLRSTESVFLELTEKIKNTDSATARTAYSMKLLGRSGVDLVPFMRLGREEIGRLMQEAKNLGAVLDEETVIQMKKLDDEIVAIRTGITGFGRQIAGDITPYFLSFTMGLKESVQWLHKFPAPIRQLITTGTLFAGTIALVGGGIALLIIKIAALRVSLAALGTSFLPFLIGGAIIAGLGAIVGHFSRMREEARLAALDISKINDVVTAQQDLDYWKKQLDERTKAAKKQREFIANNLKMGFVSKEEADRALKVVAKTYGVDEATAKVKELTTLVDKLTKAFNPPTVDAEGDANKWSLSEVMEKTKAALTALDTEMAVFGDVQDIDGKKAVIFRDAILELNAHGIDPTATSLGNLITQYWGYAEVSDNAKDATERQTKAEELLTQAQQKLADMIGNTTPDWELFAQDLERAAGADGVLAATTDRLRELAASIREAGKASEDTDPKTFADAWRAGLDDAAKDSKTFLEHIRDVAIGAFQIMETTASDMFFDSVTGQLKGLGDYAQAIFQSIARSWATMMANMMMQKMFSGMFGSPMGATSVGGQFPPGMAGSGSVTAGNLYRINERNQEYFRPSVDGTVIPIAPAGAGQQAPEITINMVNQSGPPLKGSSGGLKFDGRRWVANMVISAAADNVGGLGDTLRGGR